MRLPRGFILFAALAAILAIAFALDRPIARLAASTSAGLVDIFRIVTWFGQGGVVLIPDALILLALLWLRPRLPSLAAPIRRSIQGATVLFAAVAAAGLANDGLKLIFARGRPKLWLHGDPTGFFMAGHGADYQSFPSGHTATSVAAAIVLVRLFPRWRVAFIASALLIALSRIVLNAHYASDVAAGAMVGATMALSIFTLFQRRGWAPAEASRPAG